VEAEVLLSRPDSKDLRDFTRLPGFHDLWEHLRAPVRVDIRSKYPEKHSVTLVENEFFFVCFFARA